MTPGKLTGNFSETRMKNEILNLLSDIIRETLSTPDLVITPETSARDVDEWDSISHIEIITAVEKKFSVRFALIELQALKNVGDMIELIQKKNSAKTI